MFGCREICKINTALFLKHPVSSKFEKNKKFFRSKINLKWKIWNLYTLCSKDLKRAPLPDIFFCVKNMTEIKYPADVINSIMQT